ncbi:type VI secretion system protein TssL, long form [Thauera sinica]|uniref:Type VI secretion system protein TssL, long form n=1 Tax=Thauera sinica TaxID=2665146 RepID=A0ABW1AT97_9RHOO|nr:type VI secretion system protein TssL, long form [Thauera sp. K11]ATE59936.1 type VI secretion system protein TssL [Thauera sp. K11]
MRLRLDRQPPGQRGVRVQGTRRTANNNQRGWNMAEGEVPSIEKEENPPGSRTIQEAAPSTDREGGEGDRAAPKRSEIPADDRGRSPAEPVVDPEPDVEERLGYILSARNPLLQASIPLLRMLAEMPDKLPAGHEALAVFRKLLEQEVMTFQNLCDKANLRREHVITARYCLCTALDEAASSTEWGASGVWAEYSLAQRFHQDVEGGCKFFLLAGRLAAQPQEHIDLLEVMYRILGMGFEGQYATESDGARKLEAVRHHLYTILHAAQGPVDPALSPHLWAKADRLFKPLYSIPVWVTASVLGLVVLVFFAWHKYWLVQETNRVVAQIEAIAKMAAPSAAPPAARLRLAELLRDEIAAGRVTVKDEASRSSVVFRGDDMFLPAQAGVSPRIVATLDRLAAEIAKVPGRVVVTGHSDGQPIKTPEFPSNQVLSEKRATAVAAHLAGKGVDKARLETLGKGDTEPLADNATPAGRARNRRVEVVVAQ